MMILLASFSQVTLAAVFGVDDRVAVSERSAAFPLARATAVAVLSGLYESSGQDTIKILTDDFSGYICPRERFSRDPSLSYACTGFLIAPDLIVTAGHCMVNVGEERNETETYCQAYAWLFDYYRPANGEVEINQIPSKNLYRCKQVIYAINEEKQPGRDFAIVQLERPVLDRAPLELAPQSSPLRGDLKMIGYPLGTPAKLAKGGRVLVDDASKQQFTTTLDAFEGNSGSPVLNSRNQVVGILVSGEPIDSFVKDEVNKCEIYNRCRENGLNCLSQKGQAAADLLKTGSDVQRMAPVLAMLKELGLDQAKAKKTQ